METKDNKTNIILINEISEQELVNWLRYYLVAGQIVNEKYSSKGASSWYPYGYSIIKNILSIASDILVREAGFKEIVLPSFVHGEDFMKECSNIKDFSERVYWSPIYREDDLHVVTPTIEAQLGVIYEGWLREGKRLPYKYFTVRAVGRCETGRTIPLWKERNIWPFFEGLTADSSIKDFLKTIHDQVIFMKQFFKQLGIPILIVERPRIEKRLQEYSEKRIEAITITKDKRVVILANIYDLGEIFSKVYDIILKKKKLFPKSYALVSAIGFSGRVLAVLLSIYGDEKGFLMNPHISPIQVGIIPIYDSISIKNQAKKILIKLGKEGISSRIFSANSSFGERRKIVEAMGIPFILEVGTREIESGIYVIKTRSLIEPIKVNFDRLVPTLKKQSNFLNGKMSKKASDDFYALNKQPKDIKEFVNFTKNGYLTKISLCNKNNCLMRATSLSQVEVIGKDCGRSSKKNIKCIICAQKAKRYIYFGIKWKGEK